MKGEFYCSACAKSRPHRALALVRNKKMVCGSCVELLKQRKAACEAKEKEERN